METTGNTRASVIGWEFGVRLAMYNSEPLGLVLVLFQPTKIRHHDEARPLAVLDSPESLHDR